MVSFDGGALTDAETGEELWAGPRPSDPITDMEVSANGIAVATWNTGDNNVFEIWDVLQSRRLFGFEEAAGTQFDLSPDGRYVVLDRQGFVVVITVFGDAIDGFDVPVFTRTHFTGDGSMFLCASFNGIFEWNLYDDIDLVMDWDTLVGRVGENPCLFLR